jgi:hypothetical protein
MVGHADPIEKGGDSWDEDGARIEAEIARSTPEELQLRLHLIDETRAEHYRLSGVPFVSADAR